MKERENRNRKKKEAREHAILDFFSSAGDFGDEDDAPIYREEPVRRRERQTERQPERQTARRTGSDPRRRQGASSGRRKAGSGNGHGGSKSGAVVFVLVILAVLLVGGGLTAIKLYERYSYSKETMALADYYKITSSEDVPVLIGSTLADFRAVAEGGEIYLPFDFVKENLNARFHYDKKEGMILYATSEKMYTFPVNSSAYNAGDEQLHADVPVWIKYNDAPYMEIGFLSAYANFLWERYEEPLRLQLYLENDTVQTATVTKDTHIRYQGGVKSDVLTAVSDGEQVTVLEKLEEWSKVKSKEAVIGYVENKHLSEVSETGITIPTDFAMEQFPSLTRDHKINMAWHQVTNNAANDTIYDLLANTKAVNVVSPTWYFLSDNAGSFTTIADAGYVSAMHDKGIEVWALIDNFTNQVDTAEILSSYTNRQYLISELVASVLSVGADGINVDFELVPREAGADYIEFIRELSIVCHKNNLVLSVDNYVPTDYSDFYNRGEQGAVADYVVIMGYDEHYNGSDEAGSVASLGYVQGGIEKTIAQVPANKVINGLPFYTRLWRTSDSGIESEALTMSVAKQALEKREITPEWDEETSQYYASFEEEGKQCRIWMEEADSIRAKLSVMAQYNLGGVAEWKLGQETPDVWDQIEAYMKGEI